MDAVRILGVCGEAEVSLREGLLGNALPLQMGCAVPGRGNALPLRRSFLDDGEGDQVAGFDVNV